MKAHYVLTVFSVAMMGTKATAHFKVIDQSEANSFVDDRTQIVSNRVPHSNMAMRLFPQSDKRVISRAELKPGSAAILIQYFGPPIGNDGVIPPGASTSYYLIEVEEYQE